MASLAIQRLESALQAKKFDHTLAKPWAIGSAAAERERRCAGTGIAVLDGSLGGGWERGAISEIVGARSTGTSGVMLATFASATRRGEVVALVDTLDRFDPASAVAAGVDLDRLLWVRGSAMTVEAVRPNTAGVVAEAVQRAVRAMDLIVRAGGFGVVALDLAGVPHRILRALPLATWMRIAHVNEGRDTVGLLVAEIPLGRSAHGVSVQVASSMQWTGTSPQSLRFAGFDIRADVAGARGGAGQLEQVKFRL